MLTIRGMQPKTLLQAALAGCRPLPKPKHVFLCVADHFEPDWHGASRITQEERVKVWVDNYPRNTERFSDSRGQRPQHTFFYPIEVYDDKHIDELCKLVHRGLGDVEVHLHHDNDCSSRLRDTLEMGRQSLHHRHGLLSKDHRGEIRYGFIHGNWALDNSHPDGKWCGVNNELTVLRESGCFADFTMPAAPHPAQTRTINAIYYALDDIQRPKSHDSGIVSKLSAAPPANSLLMIQGPLAVVFRTGGRLPKIYLENGNLSFSQPPHAHRIAWWLKAGVSVADRPDWIFIKLHTHGAQEQNASVLLGESMYSLHEGIAKHSLAHGYQFYYVTAREMAQLIKQSETGLPSPDFASLSW